MPRGGEPRSRSSGNRGGITIGFGTFATADQTDSLFVLRIGPFCGLAARAETLTPKQSLGVLFPRSHTATVDLTIRQIPSW